ncbi:hypothetical protein E3J74_08925 [Candidatus Bathyarchaeota archaeon]|nr:MAG: hypothetical protein E3J74_08925 [Candidatus Bathyarchaeota archaeon]
METKFGFDKIEQRITRDEKLLFTMISYVVILIIFINLSQFESLILGLLASTIYFLINGIFLGNTFFKKETAFFRLMFGLLLLIMLLGFVGWLAVVIYNLDVIKFTLVLFIVATLSSLLNKKVKNKYGT